MRTSEACFPKRPVLLLATSLILEVALSETDHNIQLQLLRCATAVSTRHFPPDGTLVVSVPSCRFCTTHVRTIGYTDEELGIYDNIVKLLQLQIRWPIIISRPGPTKYSKSQLKEQSYVIVTCFHVTLDDMIQNLKQQLHALKARTSWNPRGLFLVLISEKHGSNRTLVRQMLELLWSFKVLNALVVVPDAAHALLLYTWYPYQSRKFCIRVKEVVLDSWLFENGGHFVSNSPLFPPKIPHDLQGCNITVSALQIEPYVFLSKGANSEDVCEDGVECRLFRLIMEKLNMTFTLKLPGEEMWGDKLENNSWSGMKGHLNKNISDLALGALILDTELCNVFECTYSYLESSSVWLLPHSKEVAKWKSVFRVFKPTVWLAFGAIYFAVVLLLWRMTRNNTTVRSETSSYANFSKCFSNVWAVVLGVTVSEMPSTSRLRVLFLTWLFYCHHINAVYLSFLTTFMIHPGYERQIKSVEELVDSDLEYGYNNGFDRYFEDPTDAILVNILRHRKHCEGTGNKCLQRLVRNKDFAILITTHVMQYRTTHDYVQQPGKPIFYSFQDAFLRNNFVMFLTKGSPLLDVINTIIRHALEGGLLDHWWKEMKNSWILSSTMEIQEESSALTLSHLQSACVIMFLGYGFCLVVFVVELTCVYDRKKAI
jgi:hypothetical protein